LNLGSRQALAGQASQTFLTSILQRWFGMIHTLVNQYDTLTRLAFVVGTLQTNQDIRESFLPICKVCVVKFPSREGLHVAIPCSSRHL
jgi:hypothetical protein